MSWSGSTCPAAYSLQRRASTPWGFIAVITPRSGSVPGAWVLVGAVHDGAAPSAGRSPAGALHGTRRRPRLTPAWPAAPVDAPPVPGPLPVGTGKESTQVEGACVGEEPSGYELAIRSTRTRPCSSATDGNRHFLAASLPRGMLFPARAPPAARCRVAAAPYLPASLVFPPSPLQLDWRRAGGEILSRLRGDCFTSMLSHASLE